MKRKTTALLLFGLCLILAVAALILALRGRGGRFRLREPVTHTVMASDTGASLAPSSGIPVSGPEVPERREVIPADYFDDAAIAGSATVTALGMYDYDGILRNADIYVTESLADTEYLAELQQKKYGKIYLGLGGEELSLSSDRIQRAVTDTVRALKETQPDAVIYLMSVTPVSEYRSTSDRLATKERVEMFNDLLLEIARQEEVWYLDAFQALSDENGYLPGDVTVDGMTFTPAHYSAWYELLQTHYIGPGGEAAGAGEGEE